MEAHAHEGVASIHPAPHTQYKDLDIGIYLHFTEEGGWKDGPKLVPGDGVSVDFEGLADVAPKNP